MIDITAKRHDNIKANIGAKELKNQYTIYYIFTCVWINIRRVGRAVDCGGLENRFSGS